jgi:alginate O-acetyltransferase complex protein AlgJ
MNEFIKSAFFVSAITCVGIASLMGTETDNLNFSKTEILQGKAAQTLETCFEAALPIRELGINFWAMLRYVVFNAGEGGVVVGESGWLFSSEEFFAPEFAQENITNNFKTISIVNDELAQRGVQLVVVPVPSKARIHEQWSTLQPTTEHQSLYPELIDFLRQHNIAHVNVLTSFIAAGGSLFLKTDTHWLPEAAAIAADGLRSFSSNRESAKQFSRSDFREASLQGDLANFIPLSPWFASFAPPEETLISWDVVANNASLDLFEDIPLPSIALVGTSYSANPRWNFDGSLKIALNEDVINFATEGQGPMVPMFEFLDEYQKDLPTLHMVVWEIPERYLVQPYASRVPRNQIHMAITLNHD